MWILRPRKGKDLFNVTVHRRRVRMGFLISQVIGFTVKSQLPKSKTKSSEGQIEICLVC